MVERGWYVAPCEVRGTIRGQAASKGVETAGPVSCSAVEGRKVTIRGSIVKSRRGTAEPRGTVRKEKRIR